MTATLKAELFDVPRTIKVSKKFLSDTIITAIEGCFGNDWFPRQRLITDEEPIDDDLQALWKASGLGNDVVVLPPWERGGEMVWDEYIAKNVAEGGTLTYLHDDGADGDPADFKLVRLDRQKLLKGLGMVLSKWPHLAEYMDTDEFGGAEYDLDAIGADAVIQCALLNDLVYG